MTEFRDSPTGVVIRVGSLEFAHQEEREARRRGDEKLDDEKADAKDVARLAEEFASLRRTLQWFMGIVAAAVVAFAGIVVQLVGS